MIAGIDYSTHAIDVVLLDEDSDAATWHRFDLEGENAFDRARDVHNAMSAADGFYISRYATFWDDVLAVGIEQPRGNFGVTHMMRIQGALLSLIPSDKLVHPLNPSEWRKTVGLPGGCSKAAVMAWVDEKMADSTSMFRRWPQDACDAYAIAYATRTLLQHGAAA